MKEHDATEQAFKNGYKKAVEDVFAEIDNIIEKSTHPYFLIKRIAELKKKYTEGEI